MKKGLLFLVVSFIFLQFDVRGAEKNSHFARANHVVLVHLTSSVTKKKEPSAFKSAPDKFLKEENDKPAETQHEKLFFVRSNGMFLSYLELGVDTKKKEEKGSGHVPFGWLLRPRGCDEKVDQSYVPHNFLRNHLVALISDRKSLEG